MKKKFKKLLAVVTAAAMLVSLSACGGGDKDSGTETKGKDSVTFNIDWPAAIDPGVGSKSADTGSCACRHERIRIGSLF